MPDVMCVVACFSEYSNMWVRLGDVLQPKAIHDTKVLDLVFQAPRSKYFATPLSVTGMELPPQAKQYIKSDMM